MADPDLIEEEKSVDVSGPEARSRVQCAEIRLVSSELRPLDPEKEKQGESRFTFKIKVDVQGNTAYARLYNQVVFVSSEEGEPLSGYWLRFTLVGVFVGDEGISPEALGDFARLYTLSILWPYAREYSSDQLHRTGEAFDSLPVINPQVLTETIIKSGLVEVVIHNEDIQVDSK